jgi:hypothetical protein
MAFQRAFASIPRSLMSTFCLPKSSTSVDHEQDPSNKTMANRRHAFIGQPFQRARLITSTPMNIEQLDVSPTPPMHH